MRRPLVVSLLALTLGVMARPSLAAWLADGTPVCTAASAQYSPAVCPDGEGGMLIAWEDLRNGAADIYCQRITRAGVPYPGWPANGAPVCLAAAAQTVPKLCPDGAGGAIIVWQDRTNGSANVDLYAQHLRGNGLPAAGWPATTSKGVIVSNAVRNQNGQRVVEDGSGGAYIVWQDLRDSVFDPDVILQHMRGDSTIAPGWPAGGHDFWVDVNLAQDSPTLLSDKQGGVFVAWADYRDGTFENSLAYEVYVAHLGSNHVSPPGWQEAGNQVTYIPWHQKPPSIVSDGAGGLLVAFRDQRVYPAMNIYAQRVNANGAIAAGWPAVNAALPVCTVTGDQDLPLAAIDGAGGMFIVWRDQRSSPAQLYASRVAPGGSIATGWPSAATGGLLVCGTAFDQSQHVVLEDGVGGFITAWRDARNAPADIYAMRMGANGAVSPGWPAAGVAVCGAAGEQKTPEMLSDGHAGAFVIWHDQRAGDGGDIYVAHLTASGDAAPVLDAPPLADDRSALTLEGAQPARDALGWSLRLATPARVRVAVLDAGGRRVRVLFAGALGAGEQRGRWDLRDERDHRVAPGLYLVEALTDGVREVRRAVVIR